MPYARANRTSAKSARDGVHIFRSVEMEWTSAGKAGLHVKAVREDAEKGHFLGLLAFDPMMRSDTHQHLGTAISFFLEGGLTDYQGYAGVGQAGINLRGATHNAASYARTVLVSRLEGPVVYPDSDRPLHKLHSGSFHGDVISQTQDAPPDILVDVDALPALASRIAGLRRQLIFDYAQTEDDRRFSQLQLLPGAQIPRHKCAGLAEWFIRGGEATIGDRKAFAGDFVIIEPGTEMAFSSDYGCLILAWAEGPVEWRTDAAGPDLYGF